MPRRALSCPPLAAALVVLLAAGCNPAPQTPASRANAAVVSSCRASTDQSFDRQNRYLLSERDTTDSPYSSSGLPGITTNGLTQRYDYDTQLAGCLASSNSLRTATQPATAVPPPPATGTARVPH